LPTLHRLVSAHEQPPQFVGTPDDEGNGATIASWVG